MCVYVRDKCVKGRGVRILKKLKEGAFLNLYKNFFGEKKDYFMLHVLELKSKLLYYKGLNIR